ncbi:hypothetical protein [Alteromonas gilva]|uniref:Lipoprotein n=1 Tax=Alteromonas gilva TaxID=2987522 RepID=A0ABT5L6H3_9ALTE|nr:hypothetical protein [Alteromonas gilva]MDC8831353.1 hypothetical protein [Alteromonas gilva]
MKKIPGIIAIALLAGCAAVNYSEIENSQAVIKNLNVTELGKAGTDKYQLDVKFDYSISDYHDIPELYTCSVLFVTSETEMITRLENANPCRIDSKTGSVSVKWNTPLSLGAGYSREALSKMALPIKYLVAIHQKKTSNKNVVIGMSEVLYLNTKHNSHIVSVASSL